MFRFKHPRTGETIETDQERLEPHAAELREKAAKDKKTAPAWTSYAGDFERVCEFTPEPETKAKK